MENLNSTEMIHRIYFNPITTEHIEFNKKIKLIQDLIEDIIDENLGKLGYNPDQ